MVRFSTGGNCGYFKIPVVRIADYSYCWAIRKKAYSSYGIIKRLLIQPLLYFVGNYAKLMTGCTSFILIAIFQIYLLALLKYIL